jgi:hypothetical protein
MPSPRVTAARRMVVLARHRNAEDPELIQAASTWAEEAIAEYVAKIVADAPPFTESQRARISALLAPATDVAA